MAEQKRGPVKPPTLDLKAKTVRTDEDKKSDKAADEQPAGKSETSRPATQPAAAPDKAKSGAGAGGVGKTQGENSPQQQGDKASQQNAAKDPSAQPKSTAEKSVGEKPGGGPAAGGAGTSGTGETAKTAEARTGGAGLAVLGGAVLGGLIGMGGAYGLAAFGLWPAAPAQQNWVSLDQLKSAQAQLDQRISVVSQTRDANLSKLQDQLDRLDTAQKALSASVAQAPDTQKLAGDIAGLSTQLTDVKARLAELAQAGTVASTAPAANNAALTALGQRIDETAAKVTDISKSVDAQAQHNEQLATEIEALKSDLAAAKASAEQALAKAARAPSDAVAQLPLALSEMEGALRKGAPFAPALAAISEALPDLAVPDDLRSAAAQGFGDPQALAARFETRVPAVLAAQPGKPDASWQDRITSRIKDLLALRPAEPIAGDSPEAMVAGLEAALGQHDFVKAQEIYTKLAEPMQVASGLDAVQLRGLALAQQYLAAARSMALAPNTGDAS